MDENFDKFLQDDYFAVDRDRLLFGGRRGTKVLEIIAECRCIERAVKAVVQGDSSGAELIVLSVENFNKLTSETKEKIITQLMKVNAIRLDVLEYSRDIGLQESVRRRVFKSSFEVAAEAA